MADYWSNLDVVTNLGSAGTELDPFGAVEFLSDIGGPGPNTYHNRGRVVCDAMTGPFRPGGIHTYVAWDLDAYGPWGVSDQSYVGLPSRGNAGNFYDCILYLRYLDNAVENVARAFVYCTKTSPPVPLKSFDMVWPGVAPVGSLVNSTVCLPFDGALGACGVVTWNSPGIAAGNLFSQETPDIGHVNASQPALPGDQVLYTGNATSSAGWAEPGLTDAPIQTMPVDGGANIYGVVLTKPIPAFGETDLTQFDLYAGYGVGAPGCWAASTPTPSGETGHRKRRLMVMGGL